MKNLHRVVVLMRGQMYAQANRRISYGDAQRALKQSEELFFTDDELDRMLPKKLRTKRP
ncbi:MULTISPECIES: hypothetical protein [Burkholderia]|uniref:hypothetical protein n=1 Tax=Burkholderia TaxID=32008 RepID=UPI000B1564CC|nr:MULTISPECIES: hypothetical protein [Burkholderia]MBO7811038.1 hypothetical protein [Burkholderia pseudomallei]MCA8310891.1 hypothetical protein [Burkholderia sp. AU28942]